MFVRVGFASEVSQDFLTNSTSLLVDLQISRVFEAALFHVANLLEALRASIGSSVHSAQHPLIYPLEGVLLNFTRVIAICVIIMSSFSSFLSSTRSRVSHHGFTRNSFAFAPPPPSAALRFAPALPLLWAFQPWSVP